MQPLVGVTEVDYVRWMDARKYYVVPVLLDVRCGSNERKGSGTFTRTLDLQKSRVRQARCNAKVFCAPPAHGFHDGDEFFARIAQHIVNTRRDGIGNQPSDYVVAFQLTKLSCQHLLTHPRQKVTNLREATGTK